ncbi:MAG: succinylglutamate desuccinylase/aspartoacylase family protein [Hyphomicrobiaceae bacterium]|nr:succinylglutamate desuccinylase/aspartoacylase family protein [Hyphomicrobiaceae bacterium]
MREPFEIGGESVPAGTWRSVALPLSRLSNLTPVSLPVQVVHGADEGPTLFVSAAVHGDEINGVEITRRLLKMLQPGDLAGTVLCVPIVNAYGFIGRSRYLPDRRDLNRSFPGSPNGSLAARLAHLFMTEVVRRATLGIDLHTAAVHRVNLPQIRSAFQFPSSLALANAFAAPVLVRSDERSGSLRKAAREIGVDVLVYEGGEGLRFDEYAIRAGLDGILGVMHHIGMLVDPRRAAQPAQSERLRDPLLANASKWIRAPEGGVLSSAKRIGEAVGEGELIGVITNPYESSETEVRAPRRGIIIGRTTLPVVNMGDALFHIAWSAELDSTPRERDAAPTEPILDEDEII